VAKLEVHHTDGNPPNKALANLVAVCNFCHRKQGGGGRVRSDGTRLLVFTNSGQVRLKEAYA
jgi:hypothetical protein